MVVVCLHEMPITQRIVDKQQGWSSIPEHVLLEPRREKRLVTRAKPSDGNGSNGRRQVLSLGYAAWESEKWLRLVAAVDENIRHFTRHLRPVFDQTQPPC